MLIDLYLFWSKETCSNFETKQWNGVFWISYKYCHSTFNQKKCLFHWEKDWVFHCILLDAQWDIYFVWSVWISDWVYSEVLEWLKFLILPHYLVVDRDLCLFIVTFANNSSDWVQELTNIALAILHYTTSIY